MKISVALFLIATIASLASLANAYIEQPFPFVASVPLFGSVHASQGSWEPNMCMMADGTLVVAADVVGVPNCGLNNIMISSSGMDGVSWTAARDVVSCALPGDTRSPVFATSALGMIYGTWISMATVWYSWSTDDGFSWAPVQRLSTVGVANRSWISVSSNTQHVYVVWSEDGALYATASTNGTVFSMPKQIHAECNKQAQFRVGGGGVLNDGSVVFIEVGLVDTGVAGCAAPAGGALIRTSRSADAGMTWQTYNVDEMNSCGQICPEWAQCTTSDYLSQSAALAMDASDNVYALYTGARNTETYCRVWFAVSGNSTQGTSWNTAVELSTAGPSAYHTTPIITAGATGDVRVAWMDNRTGEWNVFFRQSFDAGASWTPELLLSHNVTFPSARGSMVIDLIGQSHVVWAAGDAYHQSGVTHYARQVRPIPLTYLAVVVPLALMTLILVLLAIICWSRDAATNIKYQDIETHATVIASSE
eukprot:TRINITY_DN7386_c0_g2_i1.p1 TRINITY_DN7386_c0_g2~~TRINITY_DN7386_c0_g2_i1.p1  ORF type:complete len:478 (-),score=86.32 TRINITY_DN7386_c0_g2_i1:88-1521(-)